MTDVDAVARGLAKRIVRIGNGEIYPTPTAAILAARDAASTGEK